MPHYRDGTEAHVGDIVKGVTYNRKGRQIVGEILSVTPHAESCNCTVGFVTTLELPKLPNAQWHELWEALNAHPRTTHRDTGDGKGGVFVAVMGDIDYGETKAFDLIARAPEPNVLETSAA